MTKKLLTPVRKSDVPDLLASALIDCGMQRDEAEKLAQAAGMMFIERFFLSIYTRGKLELRGVVTGRMHAKFTDKLVIKYRNVEELHNGNQAGYDPVDHVDGAPDSG